MRDYARQARVALSTYHMRGRLALECLQNRAFDEFSRLYQLRLAAFHNYRVADALALKAGVDISQEEAIAKLWQEIQSLDDQLIRAVAQSKDRTLEQVVQVQKARSRIAKYRSGENITSKSGTGFTQAV